MRFRVQSSSAVIQSSWKKHLPEQCGVGDANDLLGAVRPNRSARCGPMIRIRAPQEIAAGLFLIALASFVFWQTDDLTVGTMRALGPGMMPRALATACGLCGGALVIRQSAVRSAHATSRRAPKFRGSVDDEKHMRVRAAHAVTVSKPASPCQSFPQCMTGDLERPRASFDRLRTRVFLCAMKIFPHPELVEGRRMVMQPGNTQDVVCGWSP